MRIKELEELDARELLRVIVDLECSKHDCRTCSVSGIVSCMTLECDDPIKAIQKMGYHFVGGDEPENKRT